MGKHTSYLPAIDGLRAVAVMAVVAFHAGLPVPAGFVGVDVFFVISGYLITRLLVADPKDFLGFYSRRARRILPAMVLVVSATIAMSIALLPDPREAVLSGAAASAFVANLFFQLKTGGYWAESADTMPLLHLWSLSVEEQFYLAWPVVLLLSRKRAALWVVAFGSFVAAETLIWTHPNAAFYQMPARAWELAVGGLVALGALRARHGWIGLVLVLIACAVPIPHFPGVGALPAVVGSAWLIAAVHAGERVAVLAWRPVVGVGLISYSLYLWHWPLLALDRATRVGETPLPTRLALCAVAVVLAVLTYRYVETPFRRVRLRAGWVVSAGVACAAALAVGAVVVAPPPAPRYEVRIKPLQCEPYGKGVPVAVQAPRCVAHLKKVVLLGDSYTTAWQPLAKAYAAEEGLPLTLFFDSGCPTVAGVTATLQNPVITRSCKAFNERALAWIRANRADTVIVASYYGEFFRQHPEQGRQGLANLAAALKPYARRVVFVAPTPILLDEPARCERAGVECAPTRAAYDAQAAAIRATLAELGVTVVDPSSFFCPDQCRWRGLYADMHHITTGSVEQFLQTREEIPLLVAPTPRGSKQSTTSP